MSSEANLLKKILSCTKDYFLLMKNRKISTPKWFEVTKMCYHENYSILIILKNFLIKTQGAIFPLAYFSKQIIALPLDKPHVYTLTHAISNFNISNRFWLPLDGTNL